MDQRKTFRLDKLVRNNIPRMHEEEGGSVVSRILSGTEIEYAAVKKLKEEVDELMWSRRERLGNSTAEDEYADVIEAILGLAAVDGFSRESVINKVDELAETKGTFSKGVFIETVTVPPGWLWGYYGSQPERFPEVM